MVKIALGITLGTAAVGLLFYWLKKRKAGREVSKNRREDNVAQYGVQVMNKEGNLVNLTDRPVMVVDVLTIPYGTNGSRRFETRISGVSVDADYEIDLTSDGKFLSVSVLENTVSWKWLPAKALKPTTAKIVVLS